MSDSHLIDTLEFDVAFASRDEAASAQSRLSPLVRKRLLRVVSDVFDSAASARRFDQIEIDLGTVSNLSQVHILEDRLQRQLYELLREPTRTSCTAELSSNADDCSADVAEDNSLSATPAVDGFGDTSRSFEVLSYYLIHGVLPWHVRVPAESGTDGLFESLTTLTSVPLREFLTGMLAAPNALQRFTQHCPVDVLEKTVTQLLGAASTQVLRALKYLDSNSRGMADRRQTKIVLMEALLHSTGSSCEASAPETTGVLDAIVTDFRARAVSCDALLVKETIDRLQDNRHANANTSAEVSANAEACAEANAITDTAGNREATGENARAEEHFQSNNRTATTDQSPPAIPSPAKRNYSANWAERAADIGVPLVSGYVDHNARMGGTHDSLDAEPIVFAYGVFERLVQYLTRPAESGERSFDLGATIDTLIRTAPWLLRHVFSELRSDATTAAGLERRLAEGEAELLFRALLALQDPPGPGMDVNVPDSISNISAQAGDAGAVDRYFAEALLELLHGRIDKLMSASAIATAMPSASQVVRHRASDSAAGGWRSASSLAPLLQAGDRYDDASEIPVVTSAHDDETYDFKEELRIPKKRELSGHRENDVISIGTPAVHARNSVVAKSNDLAARRTELRDFVELEKLRTSETERYRDAFDALPEPERIGYLANRVSGIDMLLFTYAEIIAGAFAEATNVSIIALRRRMLRELDDLLADGAATGPPARCAGRLLDRLITMQGVHAGDDLRTAVVRRLLAQHQQLDQSEFRQLLEALAANAVPTRSRQYQSGRTDSPDPVSAARLDELAATPATDISIGNAGLVIAAAYVPRLLAMLGLLEDGKFTAPDAAQRGALLLELLVSREYRVPEFRLVLNKLLCGLPTGAVLPADFEPRDSEKKATEGLLQGIIGNWTALGNTSIETLQSNFMRRTGRLSQDEQGWLLRVQPGPYDMLLDRLPWSISTIRNAWMPEPIRVIWR